MRTYAHARTHATKTRQNKAQKKGLAKKPVPKSAMDKKGCLNIVPKYIAMPPYVNPCSIKSPGLCVVNVIHRHTACKCR